MTPVSAATICSASAACASSGCAARCITWYWPGCVLAYRRYAAPTASRASRPCLPRTARCNTASSPEIPSTASRRCRSSSPSTCLYRLGTRTPSASASAASDIACSPSRSAISAAAATTFAEVRPCRGTSVRRVRLGEECDDGGRHGLDVLSLRIVADALDDQLLDWSAERVRDPVGLLQRIREVRVGAAHDDERGRRDLADDGRRPVVPGAHHRLRRGHASLLAEVGFERGVLLGIVSGLALRPQLLVVPAEPQRQPERAAGHQ